MHHRRKRPVVRGRTKYDKRRWQKFVEEGGEHRSYLWMSRWPVWWDVMFFRRPHRRKTAALEHAVLTGAVDMDEALWPSHRKPHDYYW